MSVIVMCLFIAALLPLLAKAPVAYAMHKLGGYDNKHPRNQQAQLTGFGARALAAHQNSFESLIIFAPAALVALVTNHTGETVQYLAIIHVLARALYNLLYLLNYDLLRTLSWTIATLASFSIIFICI
jgi:uncharacterized MAPEG superfamily protein